MLVEAYKETTRQKKKGQNTPQTQDKEAPKLSYHQTRCLTSSLRDYSL